ncbi:DUF2341 domain-containing protein, partial [Candidatus Microgenomates bacterium]|nr:DUF2341 domain-containing protein [Candidatus Microgenomates bacterium]
MKTRKIWPKVLLMVAMLVVVGGFLFWKLSRPAGATPWFDDSWAYRQIITVTNNGTAQTNYQVQVVVGTGDLIAAGKMRSDCGDVRFTDLSGNLLTYFLEYCRSGSGKNSSVWVTIPTLTTTPPPIYVYYGNPGASSKSQFTALPTGINVGDGADQSGTVSGTVNLNSTSIAGRLTGDAFNPAVTALTPAGSTTITATSSSGLVVGDEILVINLQGTSSDNSNVGKYETARVTAINGATLTLNHGLVNTYDGTTQKIMVQRVPNYAGVTVCTGNDSPAGVGCTAAGTLQPASWSNANGTGGVLFFRATGTVNVATSGTVSANSFGYVGGSGGAAGANGGNNGESYDGSNGRGGNGASHGETNGGGRSADAAVASPNDGGVRGGGGGG